MSTPETSAAPATKRSQAMSLFFAGLLPVIAFTIIEDQYGIVAGLIAGMVFGVGEIAWELFKYRKVNRMTWIGNGMLLVLGAISLISSEGIWFKLQPAIMEALFAFFLLVSLVVKKNLIVYIAEKQGQVLPEQIKSRMTGMTFRMGIFFLFHAVLATYAAFYWSTSAWAILKGVGFTLSFVLHMILEILWIRRALSRGEPPKNL